VYVSAVLPAQIIVSSTALQNVVVKQEISGLEGSGVGSGVGAVVSEPSFVALGVGPGVLEPLGLNTKKYNNNATKTTTPAIPNPTAFIFLCSTSTLFLKN
jgi:hypothetical protein